MTQADPQNLAAAAEPEQQASVTVVPQELPTRPSDVCARQGLNRFTIRKTITVTGAAQDGDNLFFWKAVCRFRRTP